jgi:hypothetical protein
MPVRDLVIDEAVLEGIIQKRVAEAVRNALIVAEDTWLLEKAELQQRIVDKDKEIIDGLEREKAEKLAYIELDKKYIASLEVIKIKDDWIMILSVVGGILVVSTLGGIWLW